MNKRTAITLAAYIATIPAANILVSQLGPIPVGFGLMAPAGVVMVGLALVLRDLAHEWAGRWAILAAIAVGTALSYLLGLPMVTDAVDGTTLANLVTAPHIATASAAAFLVAELADMAVYTPLRKRGLVRAVAASNAVGLVVDSVLFLHLAFGNFDYLPGQILAKAEMTLLAVLVLWGIARYRRPAVA